MKQPRPKTVREYRTIEIEAPRVRKDFPGGRSAMISAVVNDHRADNERVIDCVVDRLMKRLEGH